MKKVLLCFFVLIPICLSAQRVQFSGIPGEDGGMDITKLLDQIMQPHREQVSDLKNKRTDKEIELTIWTDLRTNIENFDRINRYMAGYESAFRDLTNSVSDPSVIGITATRGAEKGSHTLVIKKLAAPDSFSSSPIAEGEQLPAAVFGVTIGASAHTVSFAGGPLSSLADTLRAQLSNTLDVELINAGEKTRSVLLRVKHPGKGQSLAFDGDLSALTAAKLLTKGQMESTVLEWADQQKPLALTNSSDDKDFVHKISPRSVLTFSAESQELPPTPEKQRAALENTGLVLGAYTQNEINIPGASPLLSDTEQAKKEVGVKTSPQAVLSLQFADAPPMEIPFHTSNYRIVLDDYAGKTLQRVSVSSPELASTVQKITFTSTPEGELEPFNVISRAQDALFSYDGVDLERPSNTVGDLVRGVTIDLKKESADRVTFEIRPNLEMIQDTIAQWVLAYNKVVDLSYHATTLPRERLGKRGQMKPLHQRKKDGDDIVEGALLSNPGLLSYRASLRQLIGTPHGSATNALTLLDQVGIYVQRLRGAAPTDPESIRRGLLSLDTAQLLRALNENYDTVYRLFAENNSEGGAKGVALSASQLNASMVGLEGYISRLNRDSGDKLRTIDTEIAKKEDSLNKTERTERGNLLRMNQALAAGKAQAEALRQRFGN